jgi:two-component system response regulator MprA
MNGHMKKEMTELLVVDDEKACRDIYRRLFSGEGFAVRTARDGAEALRLFRERRPDAVLLDVELPVANGFSVCAEMRRTDPAVPILFLTAMESEAKQVRGLGVGADDYVFKTAPDQVVVARVNAAIARRAAIARAAAADCRTIALGRASIDVSTLLVSLDGRETGCRLTKTELDIVRALVDADGATLTRDEIAAALHGDGAFMGSACIRSHVAHLRRKLGPSGALIINEHDLGYRLAR